MRALLLAFALLACGPARNAVVDVLPTAPRRADCRDGAQRCSGLVPERCTVADGVGRWYPKHPLGADLWTDALRAQVVDALDDACGGG